MKPIGKHTECKTMGQTNNEAKSIIKEWTRGQINNIHTALPATVVAFDGGTGRASVRPTGYFKTDDYRNIAYPVIYNVPVIFPSGMGGAAGVTFPIRSGDGCLLVFAETQLDDFLNGGDSDDKRRFSLNDAIAIPGLYSSGATANASHGAATCLTCGGSQLILSSSGLTASLGDGTSFTFGGGDLVVNGISLCHHVHGGVQTGGGTTSTPQ